MHILKIGHKLCEWEDLKTKGSTPMARYGHSMNHYPQKNILILYGGRNDENYEENGESYLSDVWILSLDNLVWRQWDNNGDIPPPRSFHSAAVIGTSVLIFGGINDQNYCRAIAYTLNMEEMTTRQRMEWNLSKKAETMLNNKGEGEGEGVKPVVVVTQEQEQEESKIPPVKKLLSPKTGQTLLINPKLVSKLQIISPTQKKVDAIAEEESDAENIKTNLASRKKTSRKQII